MAAHLPSPPAGSPASFLSPLRVVGACTCGGGEEAGPASASRPAQPGPLPTLSLASPRAALPAAHARTRAGHVGAVVGQALAAAKAHRGAAGLGGQHLLAHGSARVGGDGARAARVCVSGRGGECVWGGVDERVLAAGLLALRRGRGGGRSHVSPVSASPLTTTTLDTPILGCWCTTSQNDCFCRRVWGGKDCWGSQVAHPPAGAGRALFVLLADEALRWAAAGGRQGARRRRRW